MDTDDFFSFFGTVVIIFFIAWGAWSGIKLLIPNYRDRVAGSDITIYQVACSGWFGTPLTATDLNKCPHPSNDGRIAYKMYPAGQYVILWYPDENSLLNLPANTPPEYHELQPCLIIDDNNWSCNGTTAEGSYTLGFFSGNYFDNNPFNSDIDVSAAQWEQVKQDEASSTNQ